MKKILGWGLGSLVALLTLGFIFLELITDSTRAQRDAAIAAVRASVLERSALPRSFPEVRPTAQGPAPEACAEQQERWLVAVSASSLCQHDTGEERTAMRAGNFLNGGYGDPSMVPAEDWRAMRAFVDSHAAYLTALKAFAHAYDPACEFPAMSEMCDIWRGLPIELNLAIAAKDYALAVEDLTCMTALRCTSSYGASPYPIRPRYAALIVDAVRAGTVPDQSWALMLRRIHGRRKPNPMDVYVARYPHRSTGAVSQEAHFIKNGIRKVVRKVQEPSLNRDAARLAPLMVTLSELSLEPYYKIEPTLRRLTEEYDLTNWDPGGYRSLSAAHASVNEIIHHVFPENAMLRLQMDLIALAIALDRHRVQRGNYPATLNEAAEFYGEAVPVNPLDGTPYNYDAADGTYRLSVQLRAPGYIPVLDRVGDGIGIGPDGFE